MNECQWQPNHVGNFYFEPLSLFAEEVYHFIVAPINLLNEMPFVSTLSINLQAVYKLESFV